MKLLRKLLICVSALVTAHYAFTMMKRSMQKPMRHRARINYTVIIPKNGDYLTYTGDLPLLVKNTIEEVANTLKEKYNVQQQFLLAYPHTTNLDTIKRGRAKKFLSTMRIGDAMQENAKLLGQENMHSFIFYASDKKAMREQGQQINIPYTIIYHRSSTGAYQIDQRVAYAIPSSVTLQKVWDKIKREIRLNPAAHLLYVTNNPGGQLAPEQITQALQEGLLTQYQLNTTVAKLVQDLGQQPALLLYIEIP